MDKIIEEDNLIEQLIRPRTELEQLLLKEPRFRKGLKWGQPRYGHPEGQVFRHVREVLDNIEKLDLDKTAFRQMRLAAIAHDTFKFEENKSFPRDWSKHHGLLAKEFMEAWIADQAVLDIIELHDEPYYAWRLSHVYKKPEKGMLYFERLLNRLGDKLELFYLFFKCDTQTGDKIQAPLEWFEEKINEKFHWNLNEGT
jgi:hypothetical protein